MPKTVFTDENAVVVAVLRDSRLAKGLRQSDVAERMGRDQSLVSLIENSQRRVDVVEFLRIADALEADPVELLREIIGRIG